MSKKYRLLKDLPDLKAGATLEFRGVMNRYESRERCKDIDCPLIYPAVVIETNPDWFQEIIEKTDEEAIAEYVESLFRESKEDRTHRVLSTNLASKIIAKSLLSLCPDLRKRIEEGRG